MKDEKVKRCLKFLNIKNFEFNENIFNAVKKHRKGLAHFEKNCLSVFSILKADTNSNDIFDNLFSNFKIQ